MFRNTPYFQAVTTDRFLLDLIAFLVILHLAGRWTLRQFGVPGLLATILRDATIYFLVIFTAHFVLVVTLLSARVSLTGTWEFR